VPLISQYLIDRYSAGPSEDRRRRVKRLHERIRDALDASDYEYETFLQGSYRNGTAIADINDVDIVALRKYAASPRDHTGWSLQFNEVIDVLEGSRIPGTIKRGDKCVKVIGALNADVVPALRMGDNWRRDPIAIYSIRERNERKNYPRRHYRNGVKKQDNTDSGFKPTVRHFKRWVRQYPDLVAPSFYIESAVHGVADYWFESYLPESFRDVGRKICRYSKYKVIYSVAGDKDILTSTEWKPADFEKFQNALRRDLDIVNSALLATSVSEANRLWKLAFGD
jgi:hypothetical protein